MPPVAGDSNRRLWILGTDSLALTALLLLIMHQWNIAIVGGGPGGLMTAYALQKRATAPYRITLYEASGRLGGKVLTPSFTHAKARYEAGAAEFYDYTPVDEDGLKELVLELGLSINPMRGGGVIADGQILDNLDDIAEHLGPSAVGALQAFDERARSRITPREFYHSGEHISPGSDVASYFNQMLDAVNDVDTRRYIETLIHSDLATEPHKTSVEYGLHNYLMNHPAYMQLYSIDGGNELLPKALADRIHARVMLNHPVTAIGRGLGQQLRVTSAPQGRVTEEEYDFVVVALPNNYIPEVRFQGSRLAEAMLRHHERFNFPAHYLRVTILFDQPFWKGVLSDGYCMLDQFGGCCLYDESSREPGSQHHVLGWLIGGDDAESLNSLDDSALIDTVLQALPATLSSGRKHVIEAHVHRWLGAVNAIPGGRSPISLDRRHQPEPLDHPNLFVVGDYLFDSTLNGVLDSAEYVAGWLAATIAETPGGPL